jgi:hypothetical protein
MSGDFAELRGLTADYTDSTDDEREEFWMENQEVETENQRLAAEDRNDYL